MSSVVRQEEMDCPLMRRKIPEQICADAILVAEDFHPERFAPQEICSVSNWKEVCRSCANNPYNESSK